MSIAAAVKQGTYKLSKIVRLPGGRSDAELLERAAVKLGTLKVKMLGPFDTALDDLAKLAAAPEPDFGALYRRALVVSELGALVGHAVVGRASFLLCDWLDLAKGAPAACRRGALLHVEAMRALRRETTPSSEQVALIKGLEMLAQQQRATAAGAG